VPQRRVYVFFRTSDRKIVSVLYWKLGDGETFSEREATDLIALNKGRIPGKPFVKLDGAELIITPETQYELQMQY
jgi:hypothetical protein